MDRRAWAHVAMVFWFMLLNYADKAVIGLSSVPIMRDLGLSNARFGELGSAFFLLFSLSGIAGGFLANHVRAKTLMLLMAVVWACALLPVAWISGFGLLLASRIALGAAEGPAFPVALHAVYKWFADPDRTLPTSVVACGAAFGTGVVAPLITWIIVRFGWHAAFGALGTAGLAWAAVWQLFADEGPLDAPTAAIGERVRVRYRLLLVSRTAIGVFLAGFGAYGVIALNLVWLANYLINALHRTAFEASWIVALPSIMQMALAPLFAGVSQAAGRRGVPSRIARGVLGSSCVVISGVSIMAMTFLGVGILKIFLIGLGFSIGSVVFTLGSALIGEISPPTQRGAMLGISNSIHTLAGLCAPYAMGMAVDLGSNPESGFRRGFICAGALVAALGVIAALLIDPEADRNRFRRVNRENLP
jgi:MFS family permease